MKVPGCKVHLGDRPINITLKVSFHVHRSTQNPKGKKLNKVLIETRFRELLLRWDLFRNYALAGISLRAKTPLHGNTIMKRVARRVKLDWKSNV